MFKTSFDSRERIWRGLNTRSVYSPSLSLGHVILHSLSLMPNKVAQKSASSGIELTFADLREQSIRAAQNLLKFDFDRGDVFAIISRNSHELAPIVFASLCSGYPLNTLDASFSEAEIVHMFGITKPKAVFCELDAVVVVEKSLRKLHNDARVFTFGGSANGTVAVSELLAETAREGDFVVDSVAAASEIAFIVCSSGTTGLPKAVCSTHESILDRFVAFSWANAEDVLFCFSSLYWYTGVMFLIYGTILNCTRIITTDDYTPELLLELIATHRATKVMASPFQLISALKCSEMSSADLASIKVIMASGSKAPYDLGTQFRKHIPNGSFTVGYGMSETSGFISVNIPREDNDSVGRLAPGLQAKVVDKDGRRLGVDAVGEIRIRPPFRVLGYFNNPEATVDLLDDEGFVCTGDVGRFDERGNLFLLDRKKDFLKYKNFMISPSEIEGFLITVPGVSAVCVVGVDDAESTDLPAAAVVRTETSTITQQDISDSVARNFSDVKKLRGGVHFFDALPTTPSGKVLRREVKRKVAEMYASMPKNEV